MSPIEKRCTHPTIHLEYYEWLGSLSGFNKNFLQQMLEQRNANGIAMFAWTRARETLRQPVPKPMPTYANAIERADTACYFFTLAQRWQTAALKTSAAPAGTDTSTPEKYETAQLSAIAGLVQEVDYLKRRVKGYGLMVTREREGRDQHKARADRLAEILKDEGIQYCGE